MVVVTLVVRVDGVSMYTEGNIEYIRSIRERLPIGVKAFILSDRDVFKEYEPYELISDIESFLERF